MKQNTMQAFSAFIYEIENEFMADCAILNLVCSGETPDEAVAKLKMRVQNTLNDPEIQINPVYERR